MDRILVSTLILLFIGCSGAGDDPSEDTPEDNKSKQSEQPKRDEKTQEKPGEEQKNKPPRTEVRSPREPEPAKEIIIPEGLKQYVKLGVFTEYDFKVRPPRAYLGDSFYLMPRASQSRIASTLFLVLWGDEDKATAEMSVDFHDGSTKELIARYRGKKEGLSFLSPRNPLGKLRISQSTSEPGEYRFNDLYLDVASVKLQRLDLGRLIEISLSFRNLSDTKKEDVSKWTSSITTATLRDSFDNTYKLKLTGITKGDYKELKDPSLYPSQVLYIMFVFEEPIDKADSLDLEFTTPDKQKVKFKIPKSNWAK